MLGQLVDRWTRGVAVHVAQIVDGVDVRPCLRVDPATLVIDGVRQDRSLARTEDELAGQSDGSGASEPHRFFTEAQNFRVSTVNGVRANGILRLPFETAPLSKPTAPSPIQAVTEVSLLHPRCG